MKAFVLDRYGKQRALQLTDVPVPDLRDDEVLVDDRWRHHHRRAVVLLLLQWLFVSHSIQCVVSIAV